MPDVSTDKNQGLFYSHLILIKVTMKSFKLYVTF